MTQETDMRRITRTCYWLVGALVAALAGVTLAAPTTANAASRRVAVSLRIPR
jgi:hypothetical protein